MDSKAPSISVIVPNYNHSQYLQQRIESILAQTYQHFELILLDDCSTDDSIEVINQYRGHKKVSHIVINEKNSGTTFKQWAKGIDLAKNEWIWIAESDDWCEPTFLQSLIEGITVNSTIAFCQSIAVRDDTILWANNYKYFHKVYDGNNFVERYMLRLNNISNASMAIFKKSIFNKIDDSFTNYKFSGDWLFWIMLAQYGQIFICGKYLNYFRKHSKDVTGPSLKRGLVYEEYVLMLKDLVRNKIIDEDKRIQLLMLKFNDFLRDFSIEKIYRKNIAYLYMNELGRKLFSVKSYQYLGKKGLLRMLAYKVQ